jgi:hypothetical protein
MSINSLQAMRGLHDFEHTPGSARGPARLSFGR